ncbi:MAG: SdrD B-like domain-containing protein [Microbacterium sp.]
MSFSLAHRAPKSIVAALLAVALGVVLALVAPAGRAAAVDFGSSPITGVTMTPTSLSDAGTGRIDFTWVAPAGAAPGDTFAISLPDELEPASTRDIELVDASTGEVAVRGTWAGKIATFTFQPYIASHTGVRGTGFFFVKWDHSVVDDGAGTFTELEIGGIPLPTITKGAAGPVVQTRSADKGGGWNDATQTQFTWFLALPGSTAGALAGPVVLSDVAPADPGYSYDCGAMSLRLDQGGFPSPTSATTYTAPASGPDVTAFDCSATQFTLTFASIPAGAFYTLIAPVVITDPSRAAFDNTASFLWPALNGAPQVEPAEIRRDDAGGTVQADQPVPGTVCVGDLVWEDLDRDGVQDAGEPGIPGVVVQLQHVAAAGTVTPMRTQTTDSSGLYRFCELPILLPGERYRTAIDLAQPALRLFAVTLSGRGAAESDSSAAEAFALTVVDLTVADAADLTLDYGFVRTGSGELAQSGASDTAGGLAAAGILVLLAGAALLRRSRRLT